MREAYSSRALCLMLPPQTQNCRQTDGTSMESALRNASHHHWCPCGTCSLWHLWQLCTKPCFLEAVIYMCLGESCQCKHVEWSWTVHSVISKAIEDSWKLKRGHLSSIIMRTIGGIFKCCIMLHYCFSRFQIADYCCRQGKPRFWAKGQLCTSKGRLPSVWCDPRHYQSLSYFLIYWNILIYLNGIPFFFESFSALFEWP